MRKKKIVIPENYLLRVPMRQSFIEWKTEENGTITLMIENTGWANRLAQKLLFRPQYSQIHLDKFGSFVWQTMDGNMNITDIGKLVEAEFGDSAHPLYERLARYFQILDSYHFVVWNS